MVNRVTITFCSALHYNNFCKHRNGVEVAAGHVTGLL